MACARIERGYTPAERWRVSFGDGSSVFVKVGTTPDTARWLRAERVQPGVPDLVEQVRGLGLAIGGVLEARHPRGGELRRTLWLEAPS